jgi:hypothetical protein
MISELAMREIEALQQSGITPTPQEVVQLNDLGKAIENQPERTSPLLAGRPIRAGNVWLWPMTLAASEWYFSEAYQHYDSDNGYTYSLAFALANGRQPKRFKGLCGKRRVRKAVNYWALRCACTPEELRSALHRLLPGLSYPHHTSVASPTAQDSSGLYLDLSVATGRSVDYWRAQDITFAGKALVTIYAQLAAGQGVAAIDGDQDEYRRAMADFERCLMAIKESHKDG